jgi:pimeloyl-ACP methyl ester carboxylesterase
MQQKSLLNFDEGKISTDEGSVSYWLRSGDEPALVLIPGSFNDRFCWKKVIDNFDQKRKILIIELRGHGNSWPPPKNGTIEQFSKDVLQVIRKINLKSFFITGHSIGGMVALQTAKEYPAEILGVISIEGWTNFRALSAFDGNMKSTLNSKQEKEFNRLRENVVARWSKDEIAKFRRIFTQWDGYYFLKSTCIPILEIYGDRGMKKPDLSELFIPHRKNIYLEWINNCSHNLMLEAPNELCNLMLIFMKQRELL